MLLFPYSLKHLGGAVSCFRSPTPQWSIDNNYLATCYMVLEVLKSPFIDSSGLRYVMETMNCYIEQRKEKLHIEWYIFPFSSLMTRYLQILSLNADSVRNFFFYPIAR